MEERRKQREQEEARRRQEEEEEEKRVALEREKQQKQYELERLKKKVGDQQASLVVRGYVVPLLSFDFVPSEGSSPSGGAARGQQAGGHV